MAIRVRVWRSLRQGVDPLDLARRLHVDRPHAELDRLRQLGGRLADAGEDDLWRDEPGAQRDVDLTTRVRIGVAAERPQEPHDRERRVGLQRVMNRVRIGGEGLVDGPVPGRYCRAAVDVEGRAVSGCEIDERDAITHERRPLAVEACHDSYLTILFTAGWLCRRAWRESM